MGNLLLPRFQLELAIACVEMLLVEACFSTWFQMQGFVEAHAQTRGRVMQQSVKGNMQSAFLL